MKCLNLTIITENQNRIFDAQQLSELILNKLGQGWELEKIIEYYKFDNSYKIELKCEIHFENENEVSHYTIQKCSSLISPWILYFDSFTNNLELIYNKEKNSMIKHEDFHSILWSNLQITDQL